MGIVNALRARGDVVTIVSLPGADPENKSCVTDKQVINPGKKVIKKLAELTRYMPEFLFEMLEILYNVSAFFRLKKVLGERDVDYIYERYSLFMFVGVLLAKRKGIPIVLEVNDSAIVERVRHLLFKGVARRFERWIFSNCSGIVFISHNFKRTVEGAYGVIDHSVVSPNGADINVFYPDVDLRAEARERLGLKGSVVCGYLGSFAHWHGIDKFAFEIAPLLKDFPNLRLLMVGDGVALAPIEEEFRRHGVLNQVVIPGRVAHSEVGGYIAAMDFGILPDSNDYGSPMKLFEMMAAGVPSVCPDYEPVVEVTIHDENGWLFKKKNIRSAVDQVLALAERKEDIERVSQGAVAYIRDQRQWKHNVDMVLDMLDEIKQK